MVSKCPFCNRIIEGSPINKRETSLLRSSCKIYCSLLLPIPFVGSYLGGKIYDLLSSPDEWFYRFVCPDCMISWIATPHNPEMKFGGNDNLVLFFYHDNFVIGNLRKNIYMIQTDEGRVETSVVYEDENYHVHNYSDGKSLVNSKSFQKIKLSSGLYIGECLNNSPDGWGVQFMNNGYIWYGEWNNGIRNGVGMSCDFDGSHSTVEYWRQGTQVKY